MISCMTMIFTLHFTLNNFCEPQKYEHFLSKMFFFKAYYRIILRKFGRKFLSLNKSSKKEKYFFHLWVYPCL